MEISRYLKYFPLIAVKTKRLYTRNYYQRSAGLTAENIQEISTSLGSVLNMVRNFPFTDKFDYYIKSKFQKKYFAFQCHWLLNIVKEIENIYNFLVQF